MYDVIIVGSGCSGYSAAMYARRLELKTLLIGEIDGGTIILTDVVENYPGFARLSGEELSNKLRDHAMQYKPDMVYGKVLGIKKEKNYFKVSTKSKSYLSKTIIIATGTMHSKLNIPGEEEFANRGVSYCSLCDGILYKNKVVAVVGGSDSAVKEALVLARYAKKVFIIYRGTNVRAEPVNYIRLKKEKKITIINETTLTRISEKKFVGSVELDKPYNGKKSLNLDAVFIAIGYAPKSELARDLGVNLNEKLEIIIDSDSKTSMPGVFAAGDITNTRFKQAIIGVAHAVTAAHSAHYYISHSAVMPFNGSGRKK